MGTVQRNMYGERTSGRVDSAYHADGTPKYLRIYDAGADVWDRYTVAFTRTGEYRGTGDIPYIAVSDGGASYHGEMPVRARPGRLITFADLDSLVQRAIMAEYRALWG